MRPALARDHFGATERAASSKETEQEMTPTSRKTSMRGNSIRAALFLLAAALQFSLMGACFGLKDVTRYPADAGPDGGCMVGAATSDFFVDPSADAGPCAFPTIGAAVAAAQSSRAPLPKTVHVPAGTYSAPAETFPIDLRGGISLVGAGRDATIVSGAALARGFQTARNALTQLSRSGPVYATFLVGDTQNASEISNLSIELPPGMPIDGREAIVCDRGNASQVPPTPNTTVGGVSIDGFEVGVRVTASGLPPNSPSSGCNLEFESSLVQNGWYGVVADGILANGGSSQPVSVRLENENTFLNMDTGGTSYPYLLNGAGLVTCDAVTGVVVKNNYFKQDPGQTGDWGIYATATDATYGSPGFDIEDNDFGPLTNGGIWLWGDVLVDKLVNNKFHDISMQKNYGLGFLAIGLLVKSDAGNLQGPFPIIRYARGNSFIGNDVGVDFRSAYTALPSNGASLHFDFGTATEAGNNIFSCNSAPTVIAGAGAGADVQMEFQTQQPVVTLPFEGNVWDHVPPTVSTGSWKPNVPGAAPPGVDIWLAGADAGLLGGNVDPANGTVVDVGPCPAGRVAGP
jgi:hypothetical protein